MDKVKLDDHQYQLFKEYIIRLYDMGKYYQNEDWDKIMEGQWFFLLPKSNTPYFIDFTISFRDNAHRIVLTEDEYGNKEYGTKLTEHYCTILSLDAINNQTKEAIPFEFNCRKLELDLENGLPLINSDI
jgi:hypothetical protein